MFVSSNASPASGASHIAVVGAFAVMPHKRCAGRARDTPTGTAPLLANSNGASK
jgi:hypothetical protein